MMLSIMGRSSDFRSDWKVSVYMVAGKRWGMAGNGKAETTLKMDVVMPYVMTRRKKLETLTLLLLSGVMCGGSSTIIGY
jgi:hypothetical protein